MKLILFLMLLFTSVFFFVKNSIMELQYVFVPQNNLNKLSWKKVKDKSIFFGHQSVGNDILLGVEELKKEFPWLTVAINKISNIKKKSGMQIFHSFIGENGNLTLKNTSFKNTVINLGNNVDVAAFKYCYVDFNANSNVYKIFKDYTQIINEIKEINPRIKIIHITVPLTSNQAGIKAFIKRFLWKPVGGTKENTVRNNYNNLLKQEYGKTDLVFDLASLESTNPDRSFNLFKYNNKNYRHLVSKYTDDGRHLNKTGRRFISEQFVLFLAGLHT